MFNNDVTLTGDSGTTTYSLISVKDSTSIRSDATQTSAAPRTLKISSTVQGKGMQAIDRHLARLDRVEVDPDDDTTTVSGSAYLVLEHPRRVITEAMILDLVTQLVDFVTADSGSNLTKLMNREP